MTWVLHAGKDNIFIDTGKTRWEYHPWHPCLPLATEPVRLLCIFIRFILLVISDKSTLSTNYLQIWLSTHYPSLHIYLLIYNLHILYLLNIYLSMQLLPSLIRQAGSVLSGLSERCVGRRWKFTNYPRPSHCCADLPWILATSAANRLIGEVVQSRRRPLLGPHGR